MTLLSARHWFEEHTGEVQLHAVAPTLAQLFVQTGLALAELMEEEAASASSEATEMVDLRAPDLEALLVEWLNELIFRAETQQKVYRELKIISLSEQELRAEIGGTRLERLRTAVKAATFHRLNISPEAGGCSATVVLDV